MAILYAHYLINGNSVTIRHWRDTATTDVTLGYFYTKTDMSVGANVAVGVYSEDSILGLDMDYTGIKKGQTVIGTIKYYDSELSSSRIILVTPDK